MKLRLEQLGERWEEEVEGGAMAALSVANLVTSQEIAPQVAAGEVVGVGDRGGKTPRAKKEAAQSKINKKYIYPMQKVTGHDMLMLPRILKGQEINMSDCCARIIKICIIA